VPFIQVTNLARTLARLKELGLWIGRGRRAGRNGPVPGGPEGAARDRHGFGGSRPAAASTREACDFTVRLPMQGVVESLNVSVATGIVLYEALRQRR